MEVSSSLLQQAYDQDDWDSDFDDDNGTSNHATTAASSGGMLNVPSRSGQSGSTGDVSSIGRSDSKKQSMSSMTSFNRFSTFVKSGGESFVLGKLNAKVQETDVIQVVVRLLQLFFSQASFTKKTTQLFFPGKWRRKI